MLLNVGIFCEVRRLSISLGIIIAEFRLRHKAAFMWADHVVGGQRHGRDHILRCATGLEHDSLSEPFALGSVYTNSDIETPPANCAVADHYLYRGLERQLREWLGQTMAAGPLGSYRSRYGLVGWDPDSEQWEYVRLNCTHACQMSRKCIDGPGRKYIAGRGLYSQVPGTPGVACAGTSRATDEMPPCHGPEGENLGGKTGCKN